MIYKELKPGTVVILPEYLQKANKTEYGIVTHVLRDTVNLTLMTDLGNTFELTEMTSMLKEKGKRARGKQGHKLREWWAQERVARFKKSIESKPPAVYICELLASAELPLDRGEELGTNFLKTLDKLCDAYYKKADLLNQLKLSAYALQMGVRNKEVKGFIMDMRLADPSFSTKREVIPEHWYSLWHLLPDNLKPGRRRMQIRHNNKLHYDGPDGTTWKDQPIPKPFRTATPIENNRREKWALDNCFNAILLKKGDEKVVLKEVILRPKPRKYNGHQWV
jgi:hypothetical protein